LATVLAVLTQAGDVDEAWRAYRRGDLGAAEQAFRAALAAEPGRIDARNGLGYVALRRGRLEDAEAVFAEALRRSPRDRDALVGAALVARRRGRQKEARELARRVLQDHPLDEEALAIVKATADADLPEVDRFLDPPAAPAGVQTVARVEGRSILLRGRDGRERPVFWKGINLGAALPGRFPSEFPERAVYREWIRGMKEAGFDMVRVYTIHPPVFYEELRTWNEAHPESPLWLAHGVWTEPPEGGDFEGDAFMKGYRAEMQRVVNLLHGRAELAPRPGHSAGRYTADVSRWWVLTILGREWEPDDVVRFEELRPGVSDFEGRYVRGRGLGPMERWLAETLEDAVAYETERYGVQRPIAFTNWPTLDPLHHPTETTKAEESAWRRRLGLETEAAAIREYDNDAVGLDMEKLSALPANRGGLFASYHAYPYYPDFMVYDPGYLKARDAAGRPAAYLGYLRELVAHHRRHPVLIAETGVPSSREIAHTQPEGWTHGGHNEHAQGEIDAALVRNAHEAGTAGALLFAWIDEWFKHNWLVIEFHRPFDRNRLWHDRQDAEQNYGLLAYRAGSPGPAAELDGRDDEWRDADIVLRADPARPASPAAGDGFDRSRRLERVALKSDETHLYILLKAETLDSDGNGQADFDRTAFAIVLDVIDPDLGARAFPAGIGLRSAAGLEAAVLLAGDRSRVVIDRGFDRFTNRYQRPYRPRREDPGTWVSPLSSPNRERITRAGERIPATILDIGVLRRGTTRRDAADRDDNADWQYDARSGVMEVRIPWGLLNVTDPSSRAVLFEGPDSPEGYRVTPGVRVACASFIPEPGTGELEAAAVGAGASRAADALPRPGPGGEVRDLPLFAWPTWEEPRWHSYRKASFGIVRDSLARIPGEPASLP
jgi:tetratricopeptide (TPR) repeat protein